MGKTKDRGKYQSISLTVDFIAEVTTFVKKSNRYHSVAEFVREAIREKMNRDTLNSVLDITPDTLTKRMEKLEISIRELNKKIENK